MSAPLVLMLPGWQGSDPTHWQMRWARTHGYTVVEQDDWLRPRRGDWLARLDEVVVDADGPDASTVLVAHGLGCIQVAAWAAVSRHTGRIWGALLVAPDDVERPERRERIPGWAPIMRQRLPFAAVLVGGSNDPHCSLERAQRLALDWGARWVDRGVAGHIDAQDEWGDWSEGQAFLKDLCDRPAKAVATL